MERAIGAEYLEFRWKSCPALNASRMGWPGEVLIRSLHETLQYVIDSPKDIKIVLDVITSFSTNSEPVLRTDLMEQVPQIAFLCHDYPDKLGGLVTGHLIPMVVKFLTDPNDLVRKTSQAALLVLLEQELVSHKDVHDQVCPIVLDLTEPDAIDYFKTEAVALMSKMAPLVGREMTKRLFLQRFTRLCSDTLFQVRKVCAANFGELSGVVGTEGTENVLLPYFLNLCEDGVWGVRKACADVFMVVSCACSLDIRKARLAPLFVSLLSDDSRWVRLAAFQNLGPFISTFADASETDLQYTEDFGFTIQSSVAEDVSAQSQKLDGENIICDNQGNSCSFNKSSDEYDAEESLEEIINFRGDCSREGILASGSSSSVTVFCEEEEERHAHMSQQQQQFDSSPLTDQFISELEEYSAKLKVSANDDPSFNELNYWRIPLPEIDLCLPVDEFAQLSIAESASEQLDCTSGDNIKLLRKNRKRKRVYAIDSSAEKVFVSRTSGVGSIGVIASHMENNVEHAECTFPEHEVEETMSEQHRQHFLQLTELIEDKQNILVTDMVKDKQECRLSEMEMIEDNKTDLKLTEMVEERQCLPLTEMIEEKQYTMTEMIEEKHDPLTEMMEEKQDPTAELGECERDGPMVVETQADDEAETLIEMTELPKCERQEDCNRDAQAKLEELASSLAEVIFSTKANSESKTYEQIESELSGHLQDRVIGATLHSNSALSSGSTSTDHESRDKSSTAESPRLTYAEVCAFSLLSSGSEEENSVSKDVPHATHEEKSKEISDDGDAQKSSAASVPLSSEICRNSYKFRMKQYDCSQSLQDLSFSSRDIYNPLPSEMRGASYREAHIRLQNININVNQTIVPKTLLEHYISMTDPMRAETVDDEITRHCAYSLPAVALTLGPKYWSVLKETYETLATDMHWKVRRTLAFSIHQLALILGPDLTQKDLLPVFEGFIKDLDEVRIGVLKHLNVFLKMLPSSQRRMFLPRLSEFLNPDNVNNWRFRLELALQLAPISDLFTPEECWTHICPITFDLMADKVVEIRKTCLRVISQLATLLMTEEENSYIVPFTQKLVEDFAQADTWTKRQSYAYVVGQILMDYTLPLSVINSLFLPKFLELANDKVANIRLVVARIINSDILTFSKCSEDYSMESVRATLHTLQNDADRDVQYFASSAEHRKMCETQDSNFY